MKTFLFLFDPEHSRLPQKAPDYPRSGEGLDLRSTDLELGLVPSLYLDCSVFSVALYIVGLL